MKDTFYGIIKELLIDFFKNVLKCFSTRWQYESLKSSLPVNNHQASIYMRKIHSKEKQVIEMKPNIEDVKKKDEKGCSDKHNKHYKRKSRQLWFRSRASVL